METIIRGSGSRVGFVLVDEKKLLEKDGWMTSHASWLDHYWTKVSKDGRETFNTLFFLSNFFWRTWVLLGWWTLGSLVCRRRFFWHPREFRIKRFCYFCCCRWSLGSDLSSKVEGSAVVVMAVAITLIYSK